MTEKTNASTPLVEARGIARVDAQTGRWLLRDVTFSVQRGERIAIVGQNGSGKTLLLRALAWLDPLDAGEILWQGRAVSPADIPCYRSQVVYLHQRPVLTDGNVEANLRRPLELRQHQGRQLDLPRLLTTLHEVGLDESFLAKSARELSGGEAQILAILRAMQLDPAVLLLDEPTAALDVATVPLLEQLVASWQRAGEGRAVVWVSHNPEQVGRVADRVITMQAGTLE